MKTNEPNGGYTQVRASEALVIEAKKSWQRLQQAKEFFFADLEEQMKENHRRFLDMLMLEERHALFTGASLSAARRASGSG